MLKPAWIEHNLINKKGPEPGRLMKHAVSGSETIGFTR